MRIILSRQKGGRGPVGGRNFLDDRVGFWGNVTAVNSQNNSCDVIADIGLSFNSIPVKSDEWVNADKDKEYVTAERNLPPVGARVFVLTPTRSISGAFVLCSGYARGDADTQTLYAESDDEKDEKDRSKERVTQGGWHETEDYANGNRESVSADGNIRFCANPEKNSDRKQEKEVCLVAWGAEIHVNEDGVSISLPKDFTLNIDGGSSVTVNKDDARTVNGKYGLEANEEIKISSKTKTVEIGNSTATLGAMIGELLDDLAGLTTTGSSSSQSASPAFSSQMKALSSKWSQVFK